MYWREDARFLAMKLALFMIASSGFLFHRFDALLTRDVLAAICAKTKVGMHPTNIR